MSLNQPSSTVSELRSIRSRSSQNTYSYQGPSPFSTGRRHQHPSVVRYFDSLTDATWNESDSDQYSAHSEPEYATDVEVLVVHRQASHQDVVQSRDKTYRKLLDMFDWDAMKMPVESSDQANQCEPAEGEQSSGEETDSADERDQPQPVAVIVQPRPQVIIIPAQSVVQYVVSRSDIQTALRNKTITTGSKLSANEGTFVIDRGNLRHPTIRTII